MNDDFVALFGGELHEPEAQEEPAAPQPSGPVAATVIASLARQCVLELPDGQRAVVEQTLFETVELGATLPVFADGRGSWSLIDPGWELLRRDPSDPSDPSWRRGMTVSFEVLGYDATHDALIGRVGEREAFAPRARLPWPHCFPGLDLSKLEGWSVELAVVDSQQGRTELAVPDAVRSPSDRLPLARLHSIQALATLRPLQRLRVIGSQEHVVVDFFGMHHAIFPEYAGWDPRAAPAIGALVEAQLAVDMARADMSLCLRCPHQPEWAEVRARYPIGTRIERASLISRNSRGMVVRVVDPDLYVVGVLPTLQLTPPLDSNYRARLELPLPLSVVGYSDERCSLVLDPEPYVAARWSRDPPRVGQVLPLGSWPCSHLGAVALWDISCRATTTRPLDGLSWGAVVEVDGERRTVVVDPIGRIRAGRAEANEGSPPSVVFDDGSRAELINDEPLESSAEGRVEVRLDGVRFSSGNVIPLATARHPRVGLALDRMEPYQRGEVPVRALVARRVPGGFVAELAMEELRGTEVLEFFVPDYQLRPQELDGLVGQTLDFIVLRISRNHARCTLSRRRLHEKQQEQLRPDTIARLQIGKVMSGIVKNVVDYGAFIDLGGVDGLLHASNMPLGPRTHPSQLLDIGQRVDVEVRSFESDHTRVELAWPRLRPLTSWEQFCAGIRIPTRVNGVIRSISEAGAEVALSHGVDGLLPATAMEWNVPVEDIRTVLRAGDSVMAEVIEIDAASKRVGLRMKGTVPAPWRAFAAQYPPGSLVSGRIESVRPSACGVVLSPGITSVLELADLGPGGPELLETLSKWDPVRVVVRGVDAAAGSVSSTLHSRLPGGLGGSYQGPLRSGAVVDGQVVETLDDDVVVQLQGVGGLGRLARADVALYLGEHIVLPSSSWVVVEVLSTNEPVSAPRLALRHVLTYAQEGLASKAGKSKGAAKESRPPATTPLDPVRMRSGHVVSLASLSSRQKMSRAALQSRFQQILGREPPAWEKPLELADAQQLVAALAHEVRPPAAAASAAPRSSLSPAAESLPLDTRIARAAPSASASPASEPAPRSEDALTQSREPASAAPPQLPGMAALRRHLLAPRAQRVDEPRRDDARRDGFERDGDRFERRTPSSAGRPPARASAAAAPEGELERAWKAFLFEATGHDELVNALLEAGLTALAGLLDRHVLPGRIPAPEWALSELARAARPSSSGGHASPRAVDGILRCLAALPNDVLPWAALAGALPPAVFLARADELERWVGEHAREPLTTPSVGRLAVARAAQALDRLPLAHAALGEWLRVTSNDALRRERHALGQRYRQQIAATTRFFERWTRRRDREFGSGSFALVLPVIDDESGATHALKHAMLLDAVGSNHADGQALFDRESRMLQDLLGVDGIPRFVARPDARVLVCEWIEGRTLSKHLEARNAAAGWGSREVLRLGHRLARVLEEIERRLPGFVHNDLAPHNVILRSERPETATLVDLGLAMHDDASLSSIIDDLDLDILKAYRAPEVCDGLRPSPQSDMYSLGLLLLQTLSSERPSHGPAAVRQALLRCSSFGRDDLTRRLARLLGQMLAPTPEQRPSCWRSVSDQLAEMADD
jgi:ribosomal protein S1